MFIYSFSLYFFCIFLHSFFFYFYFMFIYSFSFIFFSYFPPFLLFLIFILCLFILFISIFILFFSSLSFLKYTPTHRVSTWSTHGQSVGRQRWPRDMPVYTRCCLYRVRQTTRASPRFNRCSNWNRARTIRRRMFRGHTTCKQILPVFTADDNVQNIFAVIQPWYIRKLQCDMALKTRNEHVRAF